MITSGMSLKQVAAAARKDVGWLQRYVAGKHPELARFKPKRDSTEPQVFSGNFTSTKELQWAYVVTMDQRGITLYPLLWYATSEGVHAMQIDAEGPASYFRPHIPQRYIDRYCKKGDLATALRIFHRRNYDKACHPYTYKGDRDNYAAVIDDGYIAGEYLKDEAIVLYRTFFDIATGEKRFGHLRQLVHWRPVLNAVEFEHVGRRETPHFAWCRGYALDMGRLRKAA